jgi:hypothetical protein
MTPPAILWFCAPVFALLSALLAALTAVAEWVERRGAGMGATAGDIGSER